MRAALVAVAVVAAVPPGAVVLGGYVPSLPTVGWYGRYLTTDLPALVVWAVAALALAFVALRLGGGRFTKLHLGAIGAIVVATLVAGGTLWVTAAGNGGAYSPFRQIIRGAPNHGPGERITFASPGGIDLHADIWPTFTNPEVAPVPGPALVFLHGGGFIAGELGQRPWLFEAVQNAGYTVIDIEYRLAPPPRWIDAPSDVLCALAWVNEHATTYAIDPTRVTLAGDSAGGSLALIAGYWRPDLEYGLLGAHPIESSCGGTPVVPAAIVAIEPAADLDGIWQDRSIVDGRAGTPFPEAYIGGPPSVYPDRYAAASPFDLIRPDVPPTLIVTGANDHLVRLRRVQSIADALSQAGARSRLIVIPFADHGLDGEPDSAGAQLLENLLPMVMAHPGAVIGR